MEVIADIPPMSHMLPTWMLIGLAIFAVQHWTAYTGIALAIWRVLHIEQVRLRDYLKFFWVFIIWCGQTHILMIPTLFWGGWSYLVWFGVELVSAQYSSASLLRTYENKEEALETLRIGDREAAIRRSLKKLEQHG